MADESLPPLITDECSEEGDDDDGSWEDEDSWQEWDDLPSSDSIQCLFCKLSLDSCDHVFKHCQQTHDIDVLSLAQRRCMDCIEYIQVINFVRHTSCTSDSLRSLLTSADSPWTKDEFMKPVIDDDQLLQFDIESLTHGPVSMETASEPVNATLEIEHMRHRMVAAEKKSKVLADELQRAMQDMEKMRVSMRNLVESSGSNEKWGQISALRSDEDEAYFSGYGHFRIHQDMLQDEVRTESYRDAIERNADEFRGKTVLDVGCGTGILSLFAAKAGAAHVIAVDQSEIIYKAMDIIRENGFQDKVTLIKGRIEDVKLPVDKVDIIISEWMGYFLLFESMMDTVLYARHHYLAPNGRVLPDYCELQLVGIHDPALTNKHLTYWDDVYGFHMTCMRQAVARETSVTTVTGDKVVTTTSCVKTFHIETCDVKDLDFKCPFQLTVLNQDTSISALVGYFDTHFSKLPRPISFSTSPLSPATHWEQTVFLLDKPISVTKGQILQGELTCRKLVSDPRSLRISITLHGYTTYTYLMQ